MDYIVNLAKQERFEIKLLLSRWFQNSHNYQKWCEKLILAEKNIKKLEVGFAPSHTKICLIKTNCNKFIVFEGSGNLSDNDRIEQYLLEENKQTFHFYKKWIIEFIQKWKTLK